MIRLLLFCTAAILALTAAPSVGGYFDPPPGVGDGHYRPPSYNYGGAGPCPINIPRCHDTPRQQRPVQARSQRIKQPWR
jgi:hypothetical protein